MNDTGGLIIPIFTFSFNPNNYYTSINDSLIMAFSNVQICVMLSLQAISLLLIANLLLFAPFFYGIRVKIPPLMRLFLRFHTICLILNVPTYINKAFGFIDPRYNFYTVLWINNIAGPYTYTQPYFTLILTLERILMLRLPLIFMRHKRRYIYAASVFLICVYVFTLHWYFYELPMSLASALSSPPFVLSSVMFNYIPHNIIKLTGVGCDLICNVYFILLLNKEMGKKIKNRVVKFTAICEIFFEAVPGIINAFANFSKLLPPSICLFIANFNTVLATLNLCCCLIYYNWIFLLVAPRRNEGAERITVCGKVGTSIALFQQPTAEAARMPRAQGSGFIFTINSAYRRQQQRHGNYNYNSN